MLPTKIFNEYSKEELDRAYQELSPIIGSSFINQNDWGIVGNKMENIWWERKSLKRSRLVNAEFSKCNFNVCALTGSIFQQILFVNTEFKGCNLTYCVFQNCRFLSDEETVLAEGSNFGSSEFVNCHFQKVVFKASTLSQSKFLKCSFVDCEFCSDTLENTLFDHCDFLRINMRSLNLEFSVFRFCKIKEMSFPFYQFPYIIGAKEILNGNGELAFYAHGKKVTKSEYLGLLSSLRIYYAENDNPFPLTNILLFANQNEKAIESILAGIGNCIRDKDFRMMEHFCRLGKFYTLINVHTAQDILRDIDDLVVRLEQETNENLTGETIVENAAMGAARVRKLLLYDATNKQELQFEVNTKIPIENEKKVNALQNQLQQVIDQFACEGSQQFIEIRHGSPVTVVVNFIVEHPEVIWEASIALWNIIKYFGKKIRNRRRKKNETKLFLKDMREKYYEQAEMRDERWISALKTEIEKIMLESRDSLVEKKRNTINKNINAITQRVLGAVDSQLQSDKNFIILTTRNPNNAQTQ